MNEQVRIAKMDDQARVARIVAFSLAALWTAVLALQAVTFAP